MAFYSEAIVRAEEYSKRRKLSIKGQIGGGIQGVVFATDSGTAIKCLLRKEFYLRERNVYRRLAERQIEKISGFWVPKLVEYHDELLIIEMQIVSPPYVLDFASAHLDEKPLYFEDSEMMAAWEADRRELFDDRWPEIVSLMSEFRSLGIYLMDPKPGNIMFAPE